MSAARLPPIIESLEPGPINPGFLAMTEDATVRLVVVTAGQVAQLCKRDPKRTGITLICDAAQTNGIGILSRYPTAAELPILGRQTSPILITMDLYRILVMSDWFATADITGTVQVYEFWRT